jgi:hypothetical protein
MPGIEIYRDTAISSGGWWSSPIVTVPLGALIALMGTLLSGLFTARAQARLFESQERMRKQVMHRSHGEELYIANSKLRDELRDVTTRIAKSLEAGTFQF